MWISEYMKKENVITIIATGVIASLAVGLSLKGELSDKDDSSIPTNNLVIESNNINEKYDNLKWINGLEEQRQQYIKQKQYEEYLAYLGQLRQEEERKRLAEIEAKKKVEAKKQEHNKQINLASNNGADLGTFEATYYSPNCDGCSGYTKLEFDVRNTIYYQGMRVIAVDPKVIPLWSIVEVITPHETFTAIAGDVGGGIKNKRVDILVKNTATAYELGRHNVQIKFIRKGKG